jgi:hypothetical protein
MKRLQHYIQRILRLQHARYGQAGGLLLQTVSLPVTQYYPHYVWVLLM